MSYYGKWLGILGLVPFITLFLLSLFFDGYIYAYLSFALSSYSALILSFLGGVQWGCNLTAPIPKMSAPKSLGIRLSLSVVPSLMGWMTMFLEGSIKFLLMAFLFLAVFAVDIRFERLKIYPPWYLIIRKPLTVAVVATLLGAAIRARFGSIDNLMKYSNF